MTKLFEVQQVLYSRLSDIKKINGVFDYVPEETAFPYVVLGRIYATAENTKTTTGQRIEVTLDIWSGAKGKRETVEIIDLIDDALEKEFDVPGADVVDQKIRSIEVMEEINDLFHGTVVFEILLDLEG